MGHLIKGIIFVLIFVLFISRLIPKYSEFKETNIVNLLGVNWEGNIALLILIAVLVLGLVVLAIGLKSLYLHFSGKR